MNRAILCYLPKQDDNVQHFLTQTKQFETQTPLIFYSDFPYTQLPVHRIDPMPALPDNLPFPLSMASTKYGAYSSVEGVRLAQRLHLDAFVRLETDCYVTRPFWDGYLWQEWDEVKGYACAGSPVVLNLQLCSPSWTMTCVDYAVAHQRKAALPVAFEIGTSVNGFDWGTHGVLFPNGALSITHVDTMAVLLHDLISDFRNTYSRFGPYDFAVGHALHRAYGTAVFRKMLALSNSYSGCGDMHIDWPGRQQMERTGRYAAIHKWHF